jgi:hypothetical protein
MAHGVYLVGSVPMKDAETVFTEVSRTLGPLIKRIPDGETGNRLDWVAWLEPVFAKSSALMKTDQFFRIHADAKGWFRYGLRPGSSATDITLDNLLYADTAIASYQIFSQLKRAGKILPGTRFQVDLVPAHSVSWLFLVDELHAPVDPIFNAALKREITRIEQAIPHDELAIQFDIASAVFARLQRKEASAYGANKAETMETFTQIVLDLCNHVPADVELLLHLCYGDNNHKHVVEPVDTRDMVDFTNRVVKELKRPLNLVHLPVPRDRKDPAYFEPLRDLQVQPETEISLGLVHYTDGIAGTKARLETARTVLRSFSIATECGFGRRNPATVEELLRIHAVVANEA